MNTTDMELMTIKNIRGNDRKLDGSTHRNYPERNKLQRKKTYLIDIYESKAEYDKEYLSNHQSELCGRGIKYKWPEYYTDYTLLWKFANDIFSAKLMVEPYDDISYQDLADVTGCNVTVNNNLYCDFSVPINAPGVYDNSMGYGGGSPQYYDYYQRGKANYGCMNESKHNRVTFYPTKSTENVNTKVIHIDPPIPKDNYQYRTQMKKTKPGLDRVCKG